MTKITFIRHAQSVSNTGGISVPINDIGLSVFGTEQALKLAQTLPATSQVFVSPMIRTHETARPYCELHGVTPKVLDCLAEFSMISYELIAGMDGPQRSAVARPYWRAMDPNLRMGLQADTFFEFQARVNCFLDLMPGMADNTVIFGHGIWISLLKWRLLGNEVKDAQSMELFRASMRGSVPDNAEAFVSQLP